jgi:DNA-binding transcriptional regulator PaaX
LEAKGYLKPLGRKRWRFTDTAKLNLLSEIVKGRRADGKLRIVLFDVPEKYKTSRDAFRRHLKAMGFKFVQDSVWVSSMPCEDLIKLTVGQHHLQKFVTVVVGKMVTL